jgi:hypothetical protein
MSAPADPVRNPRRNLPTCDLRTGFTCHASISAATLSPARAVSSHIRPMPFYTSMIKKGDPDRKLLLCPPFT